ncbi:MAG: hypothetical protein AAB781_01785 [Patescibacteria group bacterium]
MIICNDSRQYYVSDLVAETPIYRLYLCSQDGAMPKNLLQIAIGIENNGELDRSVYFLRTLLLHAENLEEEYARVKTDQKDMLNYQFCLPEPVDSFLHEEQGGRRINILGFRNVDDVRLMVPLHNIVHRDQRRVDLRTSVWIMGKLLKILAFAHDASVSVGEISLGNILIEPDRHYVVVFNWASAQKYNDGVPSSVIREEIKLAAQCVIETLGGGDQIIPDDGSEQHASYIKYLENLARNGDQNAEETHYSFYQLVDGLWPRGYHHFTSLPRR